MTDPRPDEGLDRLTRRVDALSRELRTLRGRAVHVGATATLRSLAVGVLVLTAVPWLDYSQEEYRQGELISALGLIGRGSAVVDNRLQPIAVVVLVVAVVVAMAVPVELRFSWVSGVLAVVAVLVVINTKHADGDYSFYSWSPAPTLCLLLAIALLAVQVFASRAEVATPTRR